MSTQLQHVVESELFQPIPRRIKGKPGRPGLGCVRLFILPHSIAGVVVFCWALLSTFVALFGQLYPATVQGYTSSRGSKSTTYLVEYSYTVDGVSHLQKQSIRYSQYQSVPVGQAIAVRALPQWPELGEQVLFPGQMRFSSLIFPWVFTLFWNGILSLFWWMLYVSPLLNKQLVRKGVPTVGRLSEKRVTRNKSLNYIVHYEYVPVEYGVDGPKLDAMSSLNSLQSEQPLKSQMTVTAADYNSVKLGDAVTVLYNPKRPKRSLIYRFADYAVEKP